MSKSMTENVKYPTIATGDLLRNGPEITSRFKGIQGWPGSSIGAGMIRNGFSYRV